MGTMRERQREVQLYRGQIPSPGRPTVAWREDRVRFWAAIARGLKTEDAGVEAGVSSPVAYRWFRHAGGVNPALPQLCQAAICHSLSGRTLPSGVRKSSVCERSLGGWAGVRQRSQESCAATRRREPGAWTTRRPQRSGMRSGGPGGPRSPRWSRTTDCATTCRNGYRDWSRHPMVESSVHPVRSGTERTSPIGPIVAG